MENNGDFKPIKDKQHYLELMFDTSEEVSEKLTKEALHRAWETRNFEINLYWKRAAYFWAFNASIFALLLNIKPLFETVKVITDHYILYIRLGVIILGIIFSMAWVLCNIASKHWQENWENHINMLEDEFEGKLYKTIISKYKFPSYVSVSGLNYTLSIVILYVWLILGFIYTMHVNIAICCFIWLLIVPAIIYFCLMGQTNFINALKNALCKVFNLNNGDGQLFYKQHSSEYTD